MACIKSQRKEIKIHENKLQRAKTQVHQLRVKNRFNHCVVLEKRVTEIMNQKTVTKGQHDFIGKLQKELSYRDSAIAEMADTLESVLADTEVYTFEGGRYTDNVHACVYELLSLNVGVYNVALIIRSVLKCYSA